MTIFLSTEAELFGVSRVSALRLFRSRVLRVRVRHIVELEESERREVDAF